MPDSNERRLATRVIETFVHALNTQDIELAVEQFAPEYSGRNVPLGTSIGGREEVAQHLADLIEVFPDLHMTVHKVLHGNGSAVVYWSIEGTHKAVFQRIPATGQRATASGTTLFRLAGGRIVDGLHIWDFAGTLRSLRLLPELWGNPDGQGTVLSRYFHVG